jgi:hypothetical protein
MGLRSPGKRLASIKKLTTRDNEEAAALVRQIADRIAELKRLMLY